MGGDLCFFFCISIHTIRQSFHSPHMDLRADLPLDAVEPPKSRTIDCVARTALRFTRQRSFGVLDARLEFQADANCSTTRQKKKKKRAEQTMSRLPPALSLRHGHAPIYARVYNRKRTMRRRQSLKDVETLPSGPLVDPIVQGATQKSIPAPRRPQALVANNRSVSAPTPMSRG